MTIKSMRIRITDEKMDVRVFNDRPVLNFAGEEVGRTLNARPECVGGLWYVAVDVEDYGKPALGEEVK